jgi:hypothetical protein
MISQEQLEAWARLYDIGHQNFDGLSQAAQDARAELNRQLEEAYRIAFPGRSVLFVEFRREVIKRMRAWLKSRPPTI